MKLIWIYKYYRFPLVVIVIVVLGFYSCTLTKNQLPIFVESPDKSIRVEVTLVDNVLAYSVDYFGTNIIRPSSLELEFIKPISEGFETINITTENITNEWTPVYGENSKIIDNYKFLIVSLIERGVSKRLINVEFRIYNEGLAFHYVIPHQNEQNWTIKNEFSEFNFIKGAKAYPIERTEQTFSKIPIDVNSITEKVLTPLTIKCQNSFAAILEANVDNYPRMHLNNSEDKVLTSKLLGEANIKTPYTTPWRAILLAENESQLIEHENLVLNLNKACDIKDVSWIQPGKTISNEGAVPLNTIALKELVDFASTNGFRYVQLDWGWYGTEVRWEKKWIEDFKKLMPVEFKKSNWEENTLADPYTVGKGFVPYGWTERWRNSYTFVDLDIRELIRYGKSKNVGISLYLEAGNTLPLYDMDKLFATYAEWGVAGLKPGFVKYGKQENTEWIREMIKVAAKHHLWLCIHDVHVPDGFERTFPNLMISEGGGGQEGNHPVVQDLMLPFTRNLVGAFDYTPFFFAKNKTHAHMLAFMIVYYGPAQTIRGAYDALQDNRGEKELEFIKQVPSSWDETKVLNAKIGEYLTIARRKGNTWFIGSMTGDSPQSFHLNLDFLDKDKNYTATIYHDDSSGRSNVQSEVRIVSKNDSLSISLVRTGGCVLVLESN